MKRSWMSGFGLAALMAGLMFVVGCQEKGPAEKAGEKIDNAANRASDALNPKGPMEKAGEKLDNVTK